MSKFATISIACAGAIFVGCDWRKTPEEHYRAGEWAKQHSFSFIGDSANVVPTVKSNATLAGGCVLDKDNSVYVRLTVKGLSSRITATHLHLGADDENGPIVFDIPVRSHIIEDGGKTIQILGLWKPRPDQVAPSQSGKLYFDVHTELHPEGELRARVPVH
jgi:CHRD domain